VPSLTQSEIDARADGAVERLWGGWEHIPRSTSAQAGDYDHLTDEELLAILEGAER
jgi:hypothetical protein